MKTIKLLLILCMTFLALRSKAQTRYTRIDYNISFPTGHTPDFINKPSFRGGGFEFGGIFNQQFMLGLKLNWIVFNQHVPRSTFELGDYTINAEQFKYINIVPILIKGSYIINVDEYNIFQPYVSLGIGPSYIELRDDIGLKSVVNKAWSFTLNPEAGIMINVTNRFGFNVSGNYYQYFKTSQYDYMGNFSINLGIVMRR
jgi:opacity protein-like surface antigen